MAEPSYKIFLVDDDKFLVDMYSLKFSEKGYEIVTAASATEALEKLTSPQNNYQPNIFLIDVIMPTMDGFQLLEELKKRNLNQNAVMIILSNLGQKEDIEKALALGVDGYIIKASATPSEVVTKVVEIASQAKEKKSSA